MVKKIMRKARFVCDKEGCYKNGHPMTEQDYIVHENTCIELTLMCPYAGCNKTLDQAGLKEHILSQECKYRTVTCRICKADKSKDEKEKKEESFIKALDHSCYLAKVNEFL